jgi:hypothetical protein
VAEVVLTRPSPFGAPAESGSGPPLSRPPQNLSTEALEPRERAALAGVWAFRARSEREAEARFRRLTRQLAAEGAEPVVVGLARRATHDERRHARICTRMAARYGHREHPDDPPSAKEIGPASLSPRDRLLFEVVAFCAITESINAALMTETWRAARVPAVRAAVHVILRDEVAHSRLGWAHLAAERARGNGAFIADALPSMLAGAATEELFTPGESGPESARLVAHGELPLSTRVELFRATLRDVVFPGMEALGVDTGAGRSWLRAVDVRLREATAVTA